MKRAARAELNANDGDVAVELTMGTGGTADIVCGDLESRLKEEGQYCRKKTTYTIHEVSRLFQVVRLLGMTFPLQPIETRRALLPGFGGRTGRVPEHVSDISGHVHSGQWDDQPGVFLRSYPHRLLRSSAFIHFSFDPSICGRASISELV